MAATLEVTILSPDELLFQGRATKVILPGEQGVFEVCPFHRPLISRRLSGYLLVDDAAIPMKRGVVKGAGDVRTAIVEPAPPAG